MSLLDTLAPYREHGLLFGGGLLSGLLLFLLWWAMQPATDAAPAASKAPVAADTAKPLRQDEGVLDDITGELQPGAARSVVELESAREQAEAEQAAREAAEAEAFDAEPPTDEEAIAGALLSPEGGEGTPALRTWYVEVARGPGVSEILEIDAPSPEQALEVLRDFRGNPRVLRGPSLQPFP